MNRDRRTTTAAAATGKVTLPHGSNCVTIVCHSMNARSDGQTQLLDDRVPPIHFLLFRALMLCINRVATTAFVFLLFPNGFLLCDPGMNF